MSENNKTYRLRTKIGTSLNSPIEDKYLTLNLTDNYDIIEVMSIKINQENAYRFHSSDYGVVVGRAIANGGFGVPNVKVSIFVPVDQDTLNDPVKSYLYPYTEVTDRNKDKVRYNLLPTDVNNDCYTAVGTFPDKRLVLDDDNYLEIYDKYYKFTTRTNASGDYMIFGVPVGSHSLHVDLDLSDIGVLSQKPRDMVYKGYDKNEFENPVKFKASTNLSSLPQIISQDSAVYVYPFWGDSTYSTIGITRYDIDIDYKFEPTCVFIGSIVSDRGSHKISKRCVPSEKMGSMEELVTGTGTIEMIRKTPTGGVEEFAIQGNQLIDSDGVWCYQIPMNLDYMKTDEYGNLVPSENPEIGIPTRTKVRFRVSMDDLTDDNINTFRGKVLIPNNPEMKNKNDSSIQPDYVFGTLTDESSYRDLLWNNIYTVKSFIPRFQKGNSNKNRRFTGIKMNNYYGNNNPIPYNNMRVRLSFQFKIACLLVKLMLTLVSFFNKVMSVIAPLFIQLGSFDLVKSIVQIIITPLTWIPWLGSKIKKAVKNMNTGVKPLAPLEKIGKSISCIYVGGSLCDSLIGDWYFSPGCTKSGDKRHKYLWLNMMSKIEGKKYQKLDFLSEKKDGTVDIQSVDNSNADKLGEAAIGTVGNVERDYAISRSIDYFLQCVEISLAEEYKVIKFDFYNDWLNGVLYIPRWERRITRKRKFLGLFGKKRTTIRSCNEAYHSSRIRLTEQCSYGVNARDNSLKSYVGCKSNTSFKCHEKYGRNQVRVLKDEGVVHTELTNSNLNVYYFKPCEVVKVDTGYKKVNLFATDIVLLGSFNPWNISETPLFIDALQSTTYQLPSPLVLTDATEENYDYGIKNIEDGFYSGDSYSLNGLYFYKNDVLMTNSDGSFSEQSGVDWGVTGPGQGKSTIKRNYTPGGHFLGISCTNSQVTTKSCVNVRRICEIGVWPSSSYHVQNGDDSFFDVVPNGLISKDDISEGDFRKLFATLNQNGLATKTDRDNFTKYDFTYLTPVNFGGEMSPYYKDFYNGVAVSGGTNPVAVDPTMENYINVETGEYERADSNLGVVRRALEERDSDYMRFRLGLKKDDLSNVTRKYLNTQRGLSMPVYENSFYFYFGLHEGATALDKFRSDFYAVCESKVDKNRSLDFELYYGNDPLEAVDLTKDSILVNIFEDGVSVSQDPNSDSYAFFNIHSENYPITITHIFGGETNSVTIEQDSDETNNLTKVPYDQGGDIFGNIIKVGVHTYEITDGSGNKSTKTVVIVREGLDVCGTNLMGQDFIDDEYITRSDEFLLTETTNERHQLGGYITYDRTCSYFYKYVNTETQVETDVAIDQANIILVSGRRFFVSDWFNTHPTAYQRFIDDGYTKSPYNIIVDVTMDNGVIPVPAAGIYDVYAVYVSGSDFSEPILIGNDVEIGEPSSLDFSIFRTAVGSPEEAYNSWRTSFIKFRDYLGGRWYNDIDNIPGITNEQKWYLKKDVYYLRDNGHEDDEHLGESSNRNLVLTKFFPANIEITSDYISPLNTENLLNHETTIEITYSVEDPETGAVTTGKKAGPLKYMTRYMPFYVNALVYEGYNDNAITGTTYTLPKLTGEINGGIKYENKYGDIVLDDSIYLNSISYVGTTGDSLYNNSATSLRVQEGHPEDTHINYTPEEINLETPTIGPPENWTVSYDVFVTGPTTYMMYINVNNVDTIEENENHRPENSIYNSSSNLEIKMLRNEDISITSSVTVPNATGFTWYSQQERAASGYHLSDEWELTLAGYRSYIVPASGATVFGQTSIDVEDGTAIGGNYLVHDTLITRNIIRKIPSCDFLTTTHSEGGVINRRFLLTRKGDDTNAFYFSAMFNNASMDKLYANLTAFKITYNAGVADNTNSWKTIDLYEEGLISRSGRFIKIAGDNHKIYGIRFSFTDDTTTGDTFAGSSSPETATYVSEQEFYTDLMTLKKKLKKMYIMLMSAPELTARRNSIGLDGVRVYGELDYYYDNGDV